MAALFALLVQFTLSFGHVHVGESAASGRHFAQQIAPAAADAAQPAHREHRPGGDDLCAICLAGGMLASGALAAPPALPVPPVRVAATNAFAATPFTALSQRAAFHSRAPPRA